MPRVLTNPWFFPWTQVVAPVVLPYSAWAQTSLRVDFDVRPESFPAPRPSWLESMLARDLLLSAGLATSPATVPTDIGAWGFLVEHAQSLRPSAGRLRVVDAAGDWDSRTKGLFAERLGMGACAWLLWRRFDVVHIADAGPFIGRALQDRSNPFHGTGLRSLGLYGKNGGYKPDYFCLDMNHEAVIAESKGALGPPSAVSRDERAKAKQQVQNVAPIGVAVRRSIGRLAFSTNIRLASSNVRGSADTGVGVEDPDHDDDAIPIRMSADEIVLNAYSKVLQFFGHGTLAHALRVGLRPLLDPEFAAEVAEPVADEPVVFFFGLGGVRFGLTLGICKALFMEGAQGVAERVETVRRASPMLREAERYSTEELTVLPNGVVALWSLRR